MKPDNKDGLNCTFSSFVMALVIGILATIVLRFFAGLSWPGSIFCGVLVAVVLGALFVWIFCRELPALGEVKAPGATSDAADTSAAAASAAPAAAAVAAAPAASDPKPAPKPAAKPAAKKKAAPKKTAKAAGDTAAAKVEAAGDAAPANTDFDGDGKVEGTGEGTKPAALDGPRGGTADNLKEIKGIGPKLEKLCNTLGFYHFDQIANWTSDEVAWVDANLEGFRGRVTRDEWVAQAKILAAGGETEFSQRVEDGKVY